jgi:hypothetical protein
MLFEQLGCLHRFKENIFKFFDFIFGNLEFIDQRIFEKLRVGKILASVVPIDLANIGRFQSRLS